MPQLIFLKSRAVLIKLVTIQVIIVPNTAENISRRDGSVCMANHQLPATPIPSPAPVFKTSSLGSRAFLGLVSTVYYFFIPSAATSSDTIQPSSY